MRHAVVGVIVLGGSLLLAACGGGSSDDDDVPGGGSTRQQTGLEIAPDSASRQIGQTQQFSARALFSDGTDGPVTTGLTWSSNAPAVAGIDAAGGLATALSPGSAMIRAVHGT